MLGDCAKQKLAEILRAYPETSDERDEFPIYSFEPDDPAIEVYWKNHAAPRKREQLAQWLRAPSPKDDYVRDDAWREVLRKHFLHSLCALCDLADQGIWPVDKWRIALGVWSGSGDRMAARSWRYAAPLVCRMPDNVIQETDSLGFWLCAT